MKIWIDLENTPHVNLFMPVVNMLEAQGHAVVLTARDCAQTTQLLDHAHVSYLRYGRHATGGRFSKIAAVLARAAMLWAFVLKNRPDVALGHGSRAMSLAGRLAGIPVVNILDYEYASLGVFIWCSDRFLFPDRISRARLIECGVQPGQLRQFPGLKENVYLTEFPPPSPETAHRLGIGKDDVVALVRPPAERAHYHEAASSRLFAAVMEHMASGPENLKVLISPRYSEQTVQMRRQWGENARFIVLEQPIEAVKLYGIIDLLASGGGTMAREAAVLGIPSYSFFRGRMGMVDEALVREGRMIMLKSPDDVSRIALAPRDRTITAGLCDQLLHEHTQTTQHILAELLDTAKKNRRV